LRSGAASARTAAASRSSMAARVGNRSITPCPLSCSEKRHDVERRCEAAGKPAQLHFPVAIAARDFFFNIFKEFGPDRIRQLRRCKHAVDHCRRETGILVSALYNGPGGAAANPKGLCLLVEGRVPSRDQRLAELPDLENLQSPRHRRKRPSRSSPTAGLVASAADRVHRVELFVMKSTDRGRTGPVERAGVSRPVRLRSTCRRSDQVILISQERARMTVSLEREAAG